MLKKIKILCFAVYIIFFLSVFSPGVLASSSYVLPYPSSMPGNKFYKLRILHENFSYYWHFGNFAKFTYYLELSDRYLVESKTLFEYKQYLLAFTALLKSNKFNDKASQFLNMAREEGKNVSEKEQILTQARAKHIEEIKKLKMEIPEEFVWDPEKGESSRLKIADLFDTSIAARK